MLFLACGEVARPLDFDFDAAVEIDATSVDAADSAAISIAPDAPRTVDDLVATVAGGDEADYTFRWSVDTSLRADLTAATVANAETTKGQVWRVELVNSADAVVATDEVTILNTAPSAAVVSVPASPTAGQSVICAITTASTDADGDAITYSASWTENGAAYAGATTTTFASDTVPAGATQATDVFVCTVTATDGTDPVASLSGNATIACGALPGPTTFAFTGAVQTYTVPACVTRVTIEVWGAQGGGPQGAAGGYARGNLNGLAAGTVLYAQVGGRAGYNGGGTALGAQAATGGGASDVRNGANNLASRVIVGGGGGGGINGDTAPWVGGTGGGGTCAGNYCGGGGGAGYGGAGGVGAASGGAGVTGTHAGGAGGGGFNSGGAPSCQTTSPPTTCGTNGVLGVGGNGGPSVQQICIDMYGATSGGGGGYYGGGGTGVGYCGGGGGGGGSSWVGTLASPSFTAGARSGNGQVVITPF